jgi:hypothetical protein
VIESKQPEGHSCTSKKPFIRLEASSYVEEAAKTRTGSGVSPEFLARLLIHEVRKNLHPVQKKARKGLDKSPG